MKLFWALVAAVMMSSLSGCETLSEEEKAERRRDAFDIAGEYSVTEKSGQTQFDFKIINGKSRSDIKGLVTRRGSLSQIEMTVLQRNGIDPKLVIEKVLAGPMNFDKQRAYTGGNESKDNGKTSYFSLCTGDIVRVGQTVRPGSSIIFSSGEVSYCLNGTAYKSSRKISGELVMNVTLRYEVESDGDRKTSWEIKKAKVEYETPMKGVFARQYLGRWLGESHSTTDPYLSQLVGLGIFEFGNEQAYYAKPYYRHVSPEGSTHKLRDDISFSGNKYEFETIEGDIQYLDTEEFPSLRIVYRSTSGDNTNRLVFVGTIWSLSNFAGIILHVQSDTEKEVGSFLFYKE